MARARTLRHQVQRTVGQQRPDRTARLQRLQRTARLQRLQRTVAAALTLLVLGTVVARLAQDAAVPLPRSTELAAARTGDRAPVAAPGAERAAAESPVASPADPGRPGAPADSGRTTRSDGSSAQPDPSGASAEEGEGAATEGDPPTAVTVAESGAGTLRALAFPGASWRTEGRPVRVSLEVEEGLTVDSAAFGAISARVLTDARGWQDIDAIRFVPVQPAEVAAGADVDIRITLASPSLTARLCAPLRVADTKVSCWNGRRAVLNLHRWELGAKAYEGDLDAYRTYLVNHEVGHGLGHGHVRCAGPGQPAAIMVQQTLGLGGCTAWPWPRQP